MSWSVVRGRVRRRFVVGAGVLLGAVTVAGVGPAAASPGASSGPPSTAGLSVGSEVVSMRTPDSRTYVGSDGTLVAHVYQGPVNYQDASGAWQQIDNALVSDATGFANAANRFQVHLPRMSGSAPVSVSDGSRWVSFWLDDGVGVGVPVSSGSSETYAALPGVNVTYAATGWGLKEDVALLGPSSPRSLTYSVNTSPGLSAVVTTDGAIDFVDASGQAQFSFAPPRLSDAAGADGIASYQLAATKTGYDVTLNPDAAWMASPDRVWPVTIDPSLTDDSSFFTPSTVSPTADGYVSGGANANTNFFGLGYEKIGWSGSVARRTLQQFDLSGLPAGSQVLNATLNLYLTARTSSTPTASVGVYSATHSWTSSATWNKYDGTHTWTNPGGDSTGELAPQSSKAWATTTVGGTLNQYYSWDVTQLAAGWANATIPNKGLIVRYVDESTNSNVFTFNSSSAGGSNPLPYMAIRYDAGKGSRPFYSFDDFAIDDSTTASVNEGNGNLLVCQHDLHLPGVAGFGLSLQHCFNNLGADPHAQGGWEMPGAAIYLDAVGTSVVYHGETGIEVPFTSDGSSTGFFRTVGFDAALTTSTGTSLSSCTGSPSYKYTLTMNADGSKQYFNVSGQLVAEADQNGNAICFTPGSNVGPDSITDTGGRTINFQYTSGNVTSITAPGSCSGPPNLDGTASSSGGSLASGTYYYEVTAFSAAGEFTASTEIHKTVTGPTGSVALTWTSVPWATSYRLYRGTSTGAENKYFTVTPVGGSTQSLTDTGTTGASATPPAQSGTCLYYYSYSGTPARLASFTDPTAATTTYGYTSGNLTSIQDPNGNTTVFTPTTGKQTIWKIAQPAHSSNPTAFLYGQTHSFCASPNKTTDVTSPLGNTTQFCRDSGARIIGTHAPDGTTTATDYTDTANGGSNCVDSNDKGDSLDDKPCATESGNGNWTTYGYSDSTGQTLAYEHNPLQTSTNPTSAYTYTAHPYYPSSYTDADGNTTTYVYDTNGNQTAVTGPDGYAIQSIYDSQGELTCSQTGLLAGSGSLLVCGVGNDSSKAFYCPSGKTCPTTTYSYYPNGDLAETTDALGNISGYSYDGAGNRTSETDGGNTYNSSTHTVGCASGTTCPVTSTSYDGVGRVLTKTNPLGVTTLYTYDANGNRTCETDGLSYSSSTHTYCSSTQNFYCPSASTCPSTTDGYDANNQRTSELDPANQPSGPATIYTYDADGNQLTQTDPHGNQTKYEYDARNQPTSMRTGLTSSGSCASGTTCPTTTYGYDGDGNKITELDARGYQTDYGYDDADQLTSEEGGLTYSSFYADYVCASGHTCPLTTYAYDLAGNQISAIDPNGTETDTTYDAYNRQKTVATAVSGPNGSTTQSFYDGKGQLTCSQSGLSAGSGSSFVCDVGNDSSKAFYCPSGKTCPTTTYSYDGNGNQTAVTGPDGFTTQSVYDSTGQLTCSQSGLSTSTTSTVAASCPAGTVSSAALYYCPSANTCPTTTYSYDGNGNQTAVTGPDGFTTQSVYDSTGQLTCSQSGLSTSTTSTVAASCPAGTVSSAALYYCPSANTCPTTTYSYDGNGNQTAVTGPDGFTTQSVYDSTGQLTCSQSGLSTSTTSTVAASCPAGTVSSAALYYCPSANTCPTTTYSYDGNGNQTAVTGPDGFTTQSVYDSTGQLTCSQSGLSTSTTSTVAASCPAGTVSSAALYYCPSANTCPTTTYSYDGNGNQTAVTGPDGFTTQSVYDSTGQLTCSQSGLSAGSGSSVACGVGNDSSKAYYCPSGKTCPTTTYGYDANENQASVTDPDGYTTQSIYDNNNDLACSQSGLSTGSSSGAFVCGVGNDSSKAYYCPSGETCPTTTYSYDADGNLTTTTEPSTATITQTYDNNDLLTTTSYSDSTPTVSYTHNASGGRLSMTDGAGTINYTYDNNDQLASTTRGSDTFSYSYAPSGLVSSRTYPDGTMTTYGYDNNDSMSTAVSGGHTTSYTHNPAGDVLTKTLPNGYVETSTYDNVGRRTEINNAKSGTTLSDYAYTIDAAGRPVTVVQTGAVTGTTLYQYDNNNRLVDACYQATTCSETSGSTDPYIHYTYDGDGNRLTEARPVGTTTSSYNNTDELTSAGSTTYTYDANGNEHTAGSQTFIYNAANQLTSTTTTGVTTNYTYDGDGNDLSTSTGETTTNDLWDTNSTLPELALERDGSGTVLRTYVYGNERVSMNSGGNLYYHLYDSLGSVANLTSGTGTSEWTYAYDPFGATRTQTKNDPSAPTNPMQYAGEMLDPASGLYDLRARQYDTNSGRFLSQDPAASADQTAGTYVYANDNPTSYVDPSGTTAQFPSFVKYVHTTPCSGHTAKRTISPGEHYRWSVCGGDWQNRRKPIGYWAVAAPSTGNKALAWDFQFNWYWKALYHGGGAASIRLTGMTRIGRQPVNMPNGTALQDYPNYGVLSPDQPGYTQSNQDTGSGEGWDTYAKDHPTAPSPESGCRKFHGALYRRVVPNHKWIGVHWMANYKAGGGLGLSTLDLPTLAGYGALVLYLDFKMRWEDAPTHGGGHPLVLGENG